MALLLNKCFIDMYSICAKLLAVICFGLLPFLDMGAKQLI